jgi:hypothetical protein
MEVEGVVAESTARRLLVDPIVRDFRRAGLHLKAMRALEVGGESKRAALPGPADLDVREVWPDRRLRALAVVCGLEPPQGSRRKPLIKLLNDFRDQPVELDPDEVPLQGAPLDAAQDGLESEDDEEVARQRALEMSEFLIEVEGAEQMARDVKTEAKRERAEKKEALTAVHAAGMGALRERFDTAERAKARPLPHLTASRKARVDKRLPRPVAPPVLPAGCRPAAPPPDVERPARGEAESELGVRFPFSR